MLTPAQASKARAQRKRDIIKFREAMHAEGLPKRGNPLHKPFSFVECRKAKARIEYNRRMRKMVLHAKGIAGGDVRHSRKPLVKPFLPC